MRSLAMVAPAFNEEELIEEFIYKSAKDLARVTDDWEIVIVIDGSKDRTSELAHAIAKTMPQLKIVDLEQNVGNGANTAIGYQHSTKDIVFNNTVDAFFNTEDLEWIVPHLDHYDSISGCRTNLTANTPYQKLLTVCNRGLIRLLFPLKLKAYQTVQFHPRALFDQIRIEARSSFVSPEVLIKAHHLGYRIGEVDVVFHPRTKGTAKGGGIKHVIRSMRDIWKFWFKWVVLRQPMSTKRPVSVRQPGAVQAVGESRNRAASTSGKGTRAAG